VPQQRPPGGEADSGDFNAWVSATRRSFGWSARDLADVAGIHEEIVARIESSRIRQVHKQLAQQIAGAFSGLVVRKYSNALDYHRHLTNLNRLGWAVVGATQGKRGIFLVTFRHQQPQPPPG